ncbi:Ig-like domain-containing protein [Corallococcus exercitus]|uniref:Ig-like domain-containing protein n=1 Tax=Corallococcus exercitus TaxID=2316736 RepID=A0A7Y4KIC9_9BACT|nr:Ig-like domain-containing protein [Corallococcus exercitus]NOK34345.1 Ig-like domain-containing protein [Corallococcus exercitus]
MRIVSRGTRGFVAALVGAGTLAVVGCGEVTGNPDTTVSQTRQEDAATFSQLVARLSGPQAPEDFVRSWLAKESGPESSIQSAASRERVAQLLRDWPVRADGKLDLTRPPLRLRDLSRGSAGEGPFAFNALDANGQSLKLIVTAQTDRLLLEEDPDTQAPTAELTAPTTGSYVRSTVAVTANATDDVGVARVDFFDGTTLLGSSTAAPYTVFWNTVGQGGVHSLTAQAFDAAGNSGTSSVVSVEVDNNPPLIVSSQPQNPPIMQNYVRGTVNAAWSVALQGGAPVALAQVFQNGAVVTSNPTSNGSTYYYSWNTQFLGNRSYTLGFQVTDAAGNASAVYTRTFIVDNAKPSLSTITSPANGAVVSGVVTLAATASDSQAMAYVIFEVDGNWLTPFATSAPYTKTWDTTGLSGTHTIVAIATDRAGNERRSNPITVTVP